MVKLKTLMVTGLSNNAPTLYQIADYARKPVPTTINRGTAHKAALGMIDHGGSFAASIGTAYIHADAHNAEKLLETFEELFKQYI